MPLLSMRVSKKTVFQLIAFSKTSFHAVVYLPLGRVAWLYVMEAVLVQTSVHLCSNVAVHRIGNELLTPVTGTSGVCNIISTVTVVLEI